MKVIKMLCLTQSRQFEIGLKNIFDQIPFLEVTVINRNDPEWKGSIIKQFRLLKKHDILYCFFAQTKIYYLLFYKAANLKIINHYIGSDLYKTIKHYRFWKYLPVVNKLSHSICVSSLLANELNDYGISAKILPFTNLNLQKRPIVYPDQKTAIVYLPDSYREFYNYKLITGLVTAFPDVNFIFFPSTLSLDNLPANIKTVKFVPRENMFQFLSSCRVFIRLPLHDGLPNTLLEALSIGRWCIWNFDFPYTVKSSSLEDLICKFDLLINKSDINQKAIDHIINNYSFSNITQRYTNYFNNYVTDNF
ncbi:MAG: hypothetical protein K9M99_01495 [Candidatus Cloacimonetes bacterium]|nr:hypothetical protein [Candidatus Cloacimonadota bacterium]